MRRRSAISDVMTGTKGPYAAGYELASGRLEYTDYEEGGSVSRDGVYSLKYRNHFSGKIHIFGEFQFDHVEATRGPGDYEAKTQLEAESMVLDLLEGLFPGDVLGFSLSMKSKNASFEMSDGEVLSGEDAVYDFFDDVLGYDQETFRDWLMS